MGFSKTSQISRSLPIAISEHADSHDKVIIQDASSLYGNSLGVTFQLDKNSPAWLMEAELAINDFVSDQDLDFGVIYDPSEQGILFPASMADFVMQAIGEDEIFLEDYHLLMRCNLRVKLSLRSLEDPAEFLLLNSSFLRFRNSDRSSSGLCRTNIRFSSRDSGDHPVVIGRVLTRSVETVILDASREIVRIIPHPVGIDISRFPAPHSLTPLYGMPRVEPGYLARRGIVLASTHNVEKGGLILLSNSTLEIELPSGETVMGYVFLRTEPEDHAEPVLRRLLTGVKKLSMHSHPNQIFFEPQFRGTQSVWMVSTDSLVAIFVSP